MNILFYSHLDNNDQNYLVVFRYLKKIGATIVYADSFNKSFDNSKAILKKIDALIIYNNFLDAQAGYWLAWATSKNKDILCLLPMGSKKDNIINSLQQEQSISKKLVIEYYNSTNSEEIVKNFLKIFNQDVLGDIYNIKYTLRLSRKINEYLDWKSESTKIDKATWLRQNIQNLMEADKDWQKYLATKFKVKK